VHQSAIVGRDRRPIVSTEPPGSPQTPVAQSPAPHKASQRSCLFGAFRFRKPIPRSIVSNNLPARDAPLFQKHPGGAGGKSFVYRIYAESRRKSFIYRTYAFAPGGVGASKKF